MSKKANRPAVEKKVRRSIQYLANRDAEEAVYAISPALDVLAKQRYPTVRRVGDRIKKVLFDEQSLIYYISTQGKLKVPEGVHIVLVDDEEASKPVGNTRDHGGELADFIYHNIRCAQTHDAEIDYDLIDFGREFGIGRQVFENDGPALEPGKFVVSNATVLGLILCVVCAPENKRIRLDGNITLFNKATLDKSQLPGNKGYLLEKLESLFGVEK